MPTVLEEASSVLPPVTTAQEVREGSSSPQDAQSINQVRMHFRLVPSWLDGSCSISLLLPVQQCFFQEYFEEILRSADIDVKPTHHCDTALQAEERSADEEGLQLVLNRLKALEQENDGPERRELLKRRKKQLKDILSQHKDSSGRGQPQALLKRFEQEVKHCCGPSQGCHSQLQWHNWAVQCLKRHRLLCSTMRGPDWTQR